MSYIWCKIWIIVLSVLRVQKNHKFFNQDINILKQKKQLCVLGEFDSGCRMGRGQGLSKNMLDSMGPGSFNGEFVCMRTVFYFFKKYIHKRLFTREFNLFFLVLWWKHDPIQETELEVMLRNKNQQSWWEESWGSGASCRHCVWWVHSSGCSRFAGQRHLDWIMDFISVILRESFPGPIDAHLICESISVTWMSPVFDS